MKVNGNRRGKSTHEKTHARIYMPTHMAHSSSLIVPVASVELGRDWNAARQEGVMCDVLFALHVGPTSRRPGEKRHGGIGVNENSRNEVRVACDSDIVVSAAHRSHAQAFASAT